jgi:hypothetical protein
MLGIRSPLPREIRLPRKWDALLFLDPLKKVLDERRAR